MKPIEKQIARLPWPLPKWAIAVTIWPFIFYEPEAWADPCVRVHERYHWRDQMHWLVLPWLALYLVLGLVYMRRPANEHPLERGAYRLESECRSQHA